MATPARRRLLRRANGKLGDRVFTWSLPPVITCPGATGRCKLACYAIRLAKRFPSVLAFWRWCRGQSRRTDFADRMIREIQARGARMVRIHVSGDFYSVGYLRAWIQIAKACPTVQFWAYTRSWRVNGFRPWLRRFAALENVSLLLSADSESGLPRGGQRVAWMALHDTDTPRRTLPPGAIVFRDIPLRAWSVRKKMSGAQVCPAETGLAVAKSITCQSCKRCFRADESVAKVGRVALPMI